VTIAGVKYMYVSGEENTEIYAKKGNEGVAFYRCNTCILVAYHNDKIQPGQCRTVLAKLGDFLKESVRAICLRLASNAPPPPPDRSVLTPACIPLPPRPPPPHPATSINVHPVGLVHVPEAVNS
jgi:hypothetical protein